MLRHYFKIAWRNISRNKLYSSINVIGLSLGICACISIFVITNFELTFDTFHPDRERIYHIVIGSREHNGNSIYFQSAPPPAPSAVRQELTGMEEVAGFQRYRAKIAIPDETGSLKKFDNRLEESWLPGSIIADPQYFSIFKYEWLAGNSGSALDEPFKVVLTETRARKYFGTGPLERMIGKTVIYDDSLLVQVSGIVKDWNKNTDFPFTDFISSGTISHSFLKNSIQMDDWDQKDEWTLVKLAKGTSPDNINTQLAAMVKRHVKENPKKPTHLANLSLSIRPLSDLHFNADFMENELRTADLPILYGLMGIAIFILILAVVNFINLSTAQSFQRAKEIGLRKVMGGSRLGLVFQFLTETVVITSFAMVLAILLVNPVLAAFRSFIPTGVTFHFVNLPMISLVFLVTLVTSLMAGLYPAKWLSGYSPASSLKGNGIQKGHEKWYLRKALIVFQFTVALVFIIGTIVISDQLRFIRKKDLGFSSDAIVIVKPDGTDGLGKMQVFAQKIGQLPGIGMVALESNSPLGDVHMGMKITYKGKNESDFGVARQIGDENFIPLYQMKLVAGRNLAQSDSMKEFVINETCARLLGFLYPGQAIGRLLYFKNKPYPIVGVVADFHQHSFHESIKPMCLINQADRKYEIAVKLVAGGNGLNDAKIRLALIEKQFKQLYPNKAFYYSFFDDSIARLYEKDKRTGWLTDVAMLVTIFISCMGLFGLAMYTAERRNREIGIRKVLGASVARIATMLSRDFVVLVIIALVIASPVSFFLMNRWLRDFAYRVNIGWWVFALAGFSAIGIAVATISFQAIRAAMANPIKSLRAE